MLVDSHCHLNFADFNEDFSAVLQNAKAHDVTVMQTICTKISEFPTILRIARQYPNIYCSVGIHPHEVASEAISSVANIIQLTEDEKVIGIGETGLDYFYEHSPRSLQQDSFREHIAAARVTGLPIIIHTREADEDTIAILEEEMKKGAFKGLIHCFSSSHWLAEKAMEMGFYISISGIVTFKKADALKESVKKIPLEKLLVETDAPYLAPVPFRGKRNEPAFTKYTAEYIAELKGVSYEQVAEITTNNFYKLFTKAKR